MDRPDAGVLDDDGVDLSFAGPALAPALPWHARFVAFASAYLPLLLMATLALGTWWLVRNAPVADRPRSEAPLRHEPDYSMTRFMIQRFGANGALRTQIEGDRLRHYPDDDTLEIDNARIRSIGANGSVTLASARRAVSNGDGSEVQLFDDATVTRPPATPAGEPIEFHGEFLHAFRNTERLRSHLPVTVTQGSTRVRADGMEYDNLARTVDLKGRSRAVFQPRASKPGRTTSE